MGNPKKSPKRKVKDEAKVQPVLGPKTEMDAFAYIVKLAAIPGELARMDDIIQNIRRDRAVHLALTVALTRRR